MRLNVRSGHGLGYARRFSILFVTFRDCRFFILVHFDLALTYFLGHIWDIDQTTPHQRDTMQFHSAPDSIQGLIDRAADLATANPIEAIVAFTIVLAMTTARFAGRWV